MKNSTKIILTALVMIFFTVFSLAVYQIVRFTQGTHSFWKGYTAMEARDYEKAIPFFDVVIARSMGGEWRAYALTNRAYCYQQLLRSPQAMSDYSAALQLKPDISFALEQRGFLHDAAGEPELAFADYAKALRIDPNLADAWDRSGLYEMRQREYQKALVDFREAIRSRPDFEAAYREAGYASIHLRDHDGAISSFNTAISLNPKDGQAYAGRGKVYEREHKYDRALSDLTTALNLTPRDNDVLYARGMIYVYTKNYKDAIADFSEILRLDPRNERALQRRGLTYRRLKDYQRAIGDFSELIKLTQAGGAYNDRARTYFKDGQYSLALADYRQASEVGGTVTTQSKRLAWLLATCLDGKFRDGADAVIRATKDCELSKWKATSDIDTLAAAYAEVGKYDEAVRYERQAIGLSDDEPEWQEELKERLALFQNNQPYRDKLED